VTTRGCSFIVGAYEHPGRDLRDRSIVQVYTDVVIGALDDAGLSLGDVDGYFCDDDAPGLSGLSMAEYLNLGLRHLDSSEFGGSSSIAHVGHAVEAIAAGTCSVALIASAGLPRQKGALIVPDFGYPEYAFEQPYGLTLLGSYAVGARRHMYEFGTTSEQLAEVRVAASLHASHNPDAFKPTAVSVEQVVSSPLVSDPLHLLDCCLITDGGGALVVVSEEVARALPGPKVKVLGHGEAVKHGGSGRIDLTSTAAVRSGPAAFGSAKVAPEDIDYASIYDSFTITVVMALEDLGFCPKGEGGSFVLDGALHAPHGRLPFNTDGGGLSNNHPGNRGGVTKVIEAVRQLRGHANPGVQVPDCQLALAHGTGGMLSGRMGSATVILGQEDA
jgi:acetyl-CoA C-acetyltransferase